jgi:hypothetical protein
MNFEGALLKEQGVSFGIVIVKPHVLDVASQREDMVQFAQSLMGPIPIVLMKQDARGTPTYWGRPDIVKFLANVDPRRIPWKRFTVSTV